MEHYSIPKECIKVSVVERYSIPKERIKLSVAKCYHSSANSWCFSPSSAVGLASGRVVIMPKSLLNHRRELEITDQMK